MPPRISKNKTPAKATVVAASTSDPTTAPVPIPCPSLSEFTGDFLDLYNDILAAKNNLLDSNPGRAHQTAILELGACLVSCAVYLDFQAGLNFYFSGKIGALFGPDGGTFFYRMEYPAYGFARHLG
jgi:hypothetical protein